MKILVFMSDNRILSSDLENADYNSLSASINYEYCKKHGYDFIYYRPFLNNSNVIEINNNIDPNTGIPRHSAWSKLLSTQLALQLKYDYVVYIDSDCIFRNFEKTLESFIEPLLTYDLIFLNNFPFNHDDKPCSGFYVGKVSRHLRNLIKHWFSYDFKGKKNPVRWEQGALWQFYKKHNIHVVNDIMFLEKKGQYLRHIGTFDNKKRIPYFKQYIKDKGINFSKNILDITYIDYNTRRKFHTNKTRKKYN